MDDDADALCRVASAFGGGMARSGLACGALTGAFMALGCRRGRGTEGYEKTALYELAGPLIEEFVERFGASQCRELLPLDIKTQHDLVEEQGLFESCCLPMIQFTVDRALRCLAQEGDGRD